MPKAKPDRVVVHRIELQEKEREMLEQVAMARTVRDVMVPVAGATAVGLFGYVGYKAARGVFGWTEDAFDDLKEMVDDGILEPIVGKRTYTDPSTGKSYRNPLAGIPILGSLFGSGINIGIATNPFK